MKASNVAAVAASAMALLTISTSARPMHAGIDYQRYLAEKDDVAVELEEWMAKFGEGAAANGWIPATEERSEDAVQEDRMQRFFLTKQNIATVQEQNPNANFSTDSPFTLMTDDEFNTYVANSYVKGNVTRPNTRSRQLRQASDDFAGSSLYDTIKVLIDSALAEFTAGTVAPAFNDETGGEADINSGSVTDSSLSGSNTFSNHDDSDWWPDWWTTDAPTTESPASDTTPTTESPASDTTPTTEAPSDTAETESPAVEGESDSVDWTTSSCVSPVQNQGYCGSCWAFATVSAVESAECIANGQKSLNKYSEEQLVSCDSQNWGCNGGAPEYAYDYIEQNGLCSLDDYPYTSGNGYSSSCNSGCQTTNTGLSGYSYLQGEDDLVSALNQRPVVVAVASGNSVWKQYTSGVVTSCDSYQLDHAVVAVGYDSTAFKIRNSWGADWGESGYIRLSRSSSDSGSGVCGVLSDMTNLDM